jgi:tape measure domain-containing protein
MADSYPSVGLKVDLAELVQAREEYGRLESAVLGVGEAATKSARTADVATSQAMRMLRSRIALTKQQHDEERAGELGIARARNMSAGEVLAARRRLTQGMTAEADRQSAAEKKAALDSLNAFRRSIDERISAGRRAADAQIAEDKRAFEFNRRMWAQQGREAAQAAREAATAAKAMPRYMPTGGTYKGGSAGLSIGSVSEVLGLNRAMEAGNRVLGVFTNGFSAFRNVLGQVRSAVFDARTAIAVFAGAMVLGPIIGMADAMTALEARTRFYAARASDVPHTFEAIYQTAQDARAPLEAVATLYTRLAPLAERLGRSQADILRVAGTVAKGASIGGASVEEAKASSQQLAQALASNRLGGDELRSLAENAPILLSEIARALGMNTGEFIKWAHAGKANAEVIVGAIETASGRIDQMFAQMPVTVGQAVTVISNAFTHFVGEVDRATGASTNFANSIVGFRAFLESRDTIEAASNVVVGLGNAFHFLHQGVDVAVAGVPAIAAMVAALLGARVLPPIFLAISRAMAVFAVGAQGIGAASMAANIGMMSMATGAAKARAAIGGLVTMLGGPFGIAVIAAGVALSVYNANSLSAAEATQKFEDTQSGASGAVDRAIGFVERYGGSTDALTKILLSLNGVQDDQVKGLDEAGRAAVARAENERRLTIALLARAAAEQTAAASQLRRSSIFDKVEAGFRGAVANISTPQGKIENRRRAAEAANAARFKDSLAGELESGAKQSLAAIDTVRNLDLKITSPEDASGGGGGKADGKGGKGGKGMAGAINSIARLRAEVAGLQQEVNAVDSSPLATFAAQIQKAADVAEAGRTAGKGSKFRTEAGQLAAQKEELSIRLRLSQSIAQQTAASEAEGEQARETAAGNREAAAALDAYYSGGVQTWESYQAALDNVAAAQLTSTKRQNELNIASQFGLTSISDIATTYAEATGATLKESQALQDLAQTALNTANATDALAAAEKRREDIRARLTTANDRVATMGHDDTTELELAQQTSQVREAESRTRILAEQIYLKALQDGRAITESQAVAQARVLSLVQEAGQKIARMKIEIQDSIREGFVNTGKISFKSLKDNLTRSLRESIYDALLAKPINIVVNAAVNLLTQGVQQALSQLLSGSGGGAGGGGIFSSLATMFGGAKGGSGSFSSALDAAGPGGIVDTSKYLSKATEGITSAAGKLSGFMSMAGSAMGFAALGSTVTGMLGIGTKSKGGKIGGMVGGAAGGLAGLAGAGAMSALGMAAGTGGATIMGMQAGLVLGPVGAIVGALAGALIGGMIGGKPTNAGAGVQIVGNSSIGALSGNKRTADTEEAATSAAQAIINGVKAMQDAGITATQQITGLVIGTRDESQIYTSGGQTLHSAKGDVGAAADTALKALLQSATYANDAAKVFADGLLSAGKSFDDIILAMQKYTEAQAFGTSIGREILKYKDPKAYAIANLKDQQKTRRDELASYGTAGYLSPTQLKAFGDQMTELEGLELNDVMKQFADSVGDATHSLADFKEQQDRIKDYVTGLLGGNLSPLNPEARLAYNRDTFNKQATLADGGNYAAFSNITSYADTYLQDAQSFFGSSSAYSDIFNSVQSTLSSLSTKTIADPTVTAMGDAAVVISSAITTGSQQVVDAVVAANDALIEQIAAGTEASVNATTTSLGDLTSNVVDRNAFTVALGGGYAQV